MNTTSVDIENRRWLRNGNGGDGLEARLSASEERQEYYRQLLRAGRDPLFVYPAEPDGSPGPFVEVNDEACQRYGYSREEFLARTVFDISTFPPDRLRADIQELLKGAQGTWERVHRASNGQLIPTEVSAQAISVGGRPYIILSARDITERKRAEEELRITQGKLARINEDLEKRVHERTASLREAITQMEEFSYSVSHDLRAPVRAMHGFAALLLMNYSDRLDDDGRDYLQRIVHSGARMDRLIQDILAYSRFARCEIRLQPVCLGKLVRDLIEQCPALATARAKIEMSELSDVIAHPPSLSQAVANLLSNALKFVADGVKPRVRIWTSADPDGVRLCIQDNGIGIRPEHQPRLFRIFERIHPEKKYEGTGIGLAIVRKAVERMGGRVGVESDGMNGSIFWIQLPEAK